MIKTLRIDERMIHGQVAVVWFRMYNITHAVVANDDVAKDPIQRNSLMLAAPTGTKVAIKTVDEAIIMLNDPRLVDKNVMVIVRNAADALRIVVKVPGIPYVNVGNLGYIANKGDNMSYSSYVNLNQNIIDTLQAINQLVNVEFQVLPNTEKKSLISFLKGGNS